MGQSAEGIICYGVDFGEDLPWDWKKVEEAGFEEDVEPEEYLAFVFGGIRRSDYDDYSPYYDAMVKCLDEFGVEVKYHCMSECRMHILALRKVGMGATGGETLNIKFEELQETAKGGKEKILDALRKLGHENPPDPGWLLCSNYG